MKWLIKIMLQLAILGATIGAFFAMDGTGWAFVGGADSNGMIRLAQFWPSWIAIVIIVVIGWWDTH